MNRSRQIIESLKGDPKNGKAELLAFDPEALDKTKFNEGEEFSVKIPYSAGHEGIFNYGAYRPNFN